MTSVPCFSSSMRSELVADQMRRLGVPVATETTHPRQHRADIHQRAAAVVGQDRGERLGDPKRAEVVGLEHLLDFLDVAVEQLRRTETPALLTTMSASAAVTASAATESGLVTSSSTLTTRGSSLGFGARAVAYTLAAPRCRNSSTMALPSPRCPPVTTTVDPLMLTMTRPPVT